MLQEGREKHPVTRRGFAACGSPWQSGAAGLVQSPARLPSPPLNARARALPAAPLTCATARHPARSVAQSPSHHEQLDECVVGAS